MTRRLLRVTPFKSKLIKHSQVSNFPAFSNDKGRISWSRYLYSPLRDKKRNCILLLRCRLDRDVLSKLVFEAHSVCQGLEIRHRLHWNEQRGAMWLKMKMEINVSPFLEQGDAILGGLAHRLHRKIFGKFVLVSSWWVAWLVTVPFSGLITRSNFS